MQQQPTHNGDGLSPTQRPIRDGSLSREFSNPLNPKFIQIAVAAHGKESEIVFASDQDGGVWYFVWKNDQWEKIPGHRLMSKG